VYYITLLEGNNFKNSSLCSILHKAFGKEIISIIGYRTNADYVFPTQFEVGDR
jgi:hypothetical protein